MTTGTIASILAVAGVEQSSDCELIGTRISSGKGVEMKNEI